MLGQFVYVCVILLVMAAILIDRPVTDSRQCPFLGRPAPSKVISTRLMSLSRYADEDRLSRVSLRRCPYAILFHGVVKKDTEGTKGTNLVVHDFDCGEERFFWLLIVVVNCLV